MFLNAVILILQEILEAMLLVSILLVLSRHLHRQAGLSATSARSWLIPALALGIAGAALYGWQMPDLALWFDYVGLEVVNALLQGGIIAAVVLLCFLLVPGRALHVHRVHACMALMLALVIVREGAEIMLYLQGILGQPQNLTPVLLGAGVAVGIGVSSGLLLVYLLDALQEPYGLRAALCLLALFAGNMAAQAVLLLTQADWLPYTPELWNTASWLPEYSVPGQLLYALVGYEANPSLLQALAYAGCALLVLASPLFRAGWKRRSVLS